MKLVISVDLFAMGHHSYGSTLRLLQGSKYRVHFAS